MVLLSDAVLQLGSTVLVTCFGNETTDENPRNTPTFWLTIMVMFRTLGTNVVMCRKLGTNMACRTLYVSNTGDKRIQVVMYHTSYMLFRCRTLGTNVAMSHIVFAVHCGQICSSSYVL